MQNIYLLKDVAKISGQSVYTLKYYLKLGIIKEIGRSPDTNFRFFDDTTIEALKKIRDMRIRKASLKEIKDFLAWEEGGA
jgi:DNA-binding transcriptional MerR regulator